MDNNNKCIIHPERDCLGIAEAAILRKRIEDLEEWREKSSKFHNDFYDWQRTQIDRDARVDEKLNMIGSSVNKVIKWQEDQQMKPAKRWENTVDKIIMLIIGAVFALVVSQMGLSV
jgi:hypothetical protein